MQIKTIADAVAVLDYLHKRELLCTQCGDHLAVWQNQYHRRCDECKSSKAEYNLAKVPNVLERLIVCALQRWVAGHPTDEVGRSTGDATDNCGAV
jgi:hypothetical protein